MGEKDIIYNMRLKIFKRFDEMEIFVNSFCEKYCVSRTWFYKWKKRSDKAESD